MTEQHNIVAIDIWPLKVPLAKPYHLSKLYGTLTHSDAVIIRVTLANGVVGWGEADPGGVNFDGETSESVVNSLRNRAPILLGQNVEAWVSSAAGRNYHGAAGAAMDVACYDALGRALEKPVNQFLGLLYRDRIPLLWPTSSGTAEDDLAIIAEYHPHGFNTYMLKMGDRPIADEISRVETVVSRLPTGVAVMVDANQGWTRKEAITFAEATGHLPIILIEQPVTADDYEGLQQIREVTYIPISVDESIQQVSDAGAILKAGVADVFSIKISKNGGLCNSKEIAGRVSDSGKQVLMNSMIELGITQAASLQLGCTLSNLVDCGHAYMSTLRMADDITDFSDWISNGMVKLHGAPGLGVTVSMEKINKYKTAEYHVN